MISLGEILQHPFDSIVSVDPLEDGSFVVGSLGRAKIWKRRPTDNRLELRATFSHKSLFQAGKCQAVVSAVLRNPNTLITSFCSWESGSFAPSGLAIWSLSTFECLHEIPTSKKVHRLVKSKGKAPILVCVLDDSFDVRSLDSKITLRRADWLKQPGDIIGICALSDGSFVSVAPYSFIKWDVERTVLLRYPEIQDSVGEMEELFPGTFSTLSKSSLTIWSANDPVPLRKVDLVNNGVPVNPFQCTFVFREHFVTATEIVGEGPWFRKSHALELWTSGGENVQSMVFPSNILVARGLPDRTLLIATPERIEIFGYRWEVEYGAVVAPKSRTWYNIRTPSLVDLCCRSIRTHRELFKLENALPPELLVKCETPSAKYFGYH